MTERTNALAPALALVATLVAMPVAPPAHAAEPPDRLNYEGVLRGADDAPLDGAFDMVFRFFASDAGGSALLIDAHLVAGTGPVIVDGGLFNAALGGGAVADGPGAGTYASLSDLFGDFQQIWMELEISGETLAPRVEIRSAAYALNAGRLDGLDSADVLRSNASDLYTAGTLTLSTSSTLDVRGALRVFGGGPAPGRVLTSDAAGNATWQDPPAGASPLLLPEIADRLGVEDPSALPFAALRPLDCSTGPATLVLEVGGAPFGEAIGFVGRDAIDEVPYYRVAVRHPDPTADTLGQIGNLGRLTLTRAGLTTTWSGDVTESSLAAVLGDGSAIFVVELRPTLARLARSTGYRIFQDRTAFQALTGVLDDAGISDYASAIGGSYEPRSMIVQWKETELDFVRRVAAESGIHLHFEETGTGAQLVLGDLNASFPSAGTLDYVGDGEDPGAGQEFVATFAAPERTFTAQTRVRGYDFEDPSADAVATVATGGDTGLEYELAGVESGAQALARATVAAERERTRAGLHRGSGNAAALKAGHRFVLNDATGSGELGAEYVVTAIDHFVDAGAACIEYGNTFEALPVDVPYRPALATPKPRVEGPVLGEVGGPAGQGYHTDEYGRVKVRFHWDRSNPLDENASAWIRVAAPPGKQDRDLWLPRVGSEVLVDFVDGDPDRPIVVGSLSNADDMPVFALPESTGLDFLDAGTYVDGALFLTDPRSLQSPSGKGITERIVFYGATLSRLYTAPAGEPQPFDTSFKMDDELIVEGEMRLDGPLAFPADGTGGSLGWNGTSFDLSGDLQLGGDLDLGLLRLAGDTLSSTSSLEIDAASSLDLTGVTARLAGDGATFISAGSEIDMVGTTLDVNTSLSHFQGQVVAGGPLIASTTLSVAQTATIASDLTVNGGDIFSNTGLRLHATSRIDYSDGSVYTFLDDDGNETGAFHAWYHNGVPLPANQIAELQEDGDLRIRGTISQNVNFDVAESFLASEPLQPGDVVRLDPSRAGAVLRTRGAGDPLAIGVVSTSPGIVLGGAPFDAEELRRAWGDDVAARYAAERPVLRERVLARRADLSRAPGDAPGDVAAIENAIESACLEEFHAKVTAPIALSGRVPVRVDASFGAIRPGDALTPSPVAGVAMRLDGAGPSIGIALDGLDAGRGLVLALVERGHRAAPAVAAAPDTPGAPGAPRPFEPGPVAEGGGDGDGAIAIDLGVSGAAPTAAPASGLPAAPWTVVRSRPETPSPDGGAARDAEAVLRLDADGNLFLRGALQPDAMDLAETFRLADDATAQPGDLLVVDPETPGRYRPGARAADPAVVGIVSERPGVLLGAGIERILAAAPELAERWREARLARDVEAEETAWAALVERFRATHAPVALSGTVPCKVDAGYGAIRPGDLLTTSPTAGHAMRAADPAPGTVVGKALEPLAEGTGLIRVLVLMR